MRDPDKKPLAQCLPAEVRLLGARVQMTMGSKPFHEWLDQDGSPWTQFHRTETGYLLRFPGLADFALSAADLAVACCPVPGVTEATWRQLFLNHVLPLVLSKRGKLVFHASAVEVAGRAAAFVAESGGGKSTLAASFASGGYRFLADDGLVVEASERGYQAMPSHPSVRLWEDSQSVLVSPGAVAEPAVQYTPKARFRAGGDFAFCDEPRPLARAYFLGNGRARKVTFEPMSPAEAAMRWVKGSFLLDLEEKTLLAAQFGEVAALADQVSCYRLDYPRRFADLSRIREAIVRHLADAGRPPH